tara:strand:- start:2201 stop:2320 length:120 start_codon:yes stop_codon:yes gene_type:complete
MSDLDVSFLILFTPIMLGTIWFMIALANIGKYTDDDDRL